MPSRRSRTGFGMIRPVLRDTRTLSPSSVNFHSTSVGFLEDQYQHVSNKTKDYLYLSTVNNAILSNILKLVGRLLLYGIYLDIN